MYGNYLYLDNSVNSLFSDKIIVLLNLLQLIDDKYLLHVNAVKIFMNNLKHCTLISNEQILY